VLRAGIRHTALGRDREFDEHRASNIRSLRVSGQRCRLESFPDESVHVLDPIEVTWFREGRTAQRRNCGRTAHPPSVVHGLRPNRKDCGTRTLRDELILGQGRKPGDAHHIIGAVLAPTSSSGANAAAAGIIRHING
jgi:hypothetical protein